MKYGRGFVRCSASTRSIRLLSTREALHEMPTYNDELGGRAGCYSAIITARFWVPGDEHEGRRLRKRYSALIIPACAFLAQMKRASAGGAGGNWLAWLHETNNMT